MVGSRRRQINRRAGTVKQMTALTNLVYGASRPCGAVILISPRTAPLRGGDVGGSEAKAAAPGLQSRIAARYFHTRGGGKSAPFFFSSPPLPESIILGKHLNVMF